MPAVSKQQRKFMGLVHAVQQGKVPASKVSKSTRDAAKQMKKKDVEDFASTDEKGLPTKKTESGILYKAGVKKYGKEGMKKIQQAAGKRKSHSEIGKIKDKYEKGKKESVREDNIKFSKEEMSQLHKDGKIEKDGHTIEFGESVNEAERDYKDEYKKFQSSTKSKKYRAELNKYNRKKGTYGNGDGKDASHKGGKIVGFESESKNRGRAEKSRLKKEDILNENPGAMAAAAMATVKMKNAQGKQIKGTTALQSSDPSVKKKAKSIFQRLKDKFSKKKGKKDFEKQKKKVAKGADAWVKKQSKSDADFYKRQFTGESIIIDGKKYRPIKESNQRIFKENYDKIFRSLK